MKQCFLDAKRPCDLTCKAAFEVDDPVDNVDCYFIWLAHHFGESLFDLKRFTEGLNFGPGGGPFPPGGPTSGMSPGSSPGPKGFPKN